MDVISNPQNAAARTRIEWPSMNPEFIEMVERTKAVLPNPPSHVREEAMKLLHEEKEKCDMMASVPYDNAIFDRFPRHSNDIESIRRVLTALYYRGRLQSAIMDVFLMLVQRGFVSLDSLRKHVTLGSSSDASFRLFGLFYTFQAVVNETDYELQNQCPFTLWCVEPAYEAVDWLATMIVRSGYANIERLLETIEMSGYLGEINKEAYKNPLKVQETYDEVLKAQPPASLMCDPNDRAPSYSPSGPSNDFGFWLPHGLGEGPESEILDKIAESRAHFHRIETVYKHFFNIKDDVLVTAEQQAARRQRSRKR